MEKIEDVIDQTSNTISNSTIFHKTGLPKVTEWEVYNYMSSVITDVYLFNAKTIQGQYFLEIHWVEIATHTEKTLTKYSWMHSAT